MNTARDNDSLEALRAEVDRIDHAIHDLLMERADVVARVGGAKEGQGGALRPGREAQVLRSLVERHAGRFPKAAVVRIWREIMSASVWLQGPFAVAVYEPRGEPGYWDLARAQYGMVAPHAAYRSAGEVVGAVAGGRATAGVLPIPGTAEGEPWWLHLLGPGPDTPRVIGRLPFTGPGTVREDGLEAMTVARTEPEPTGDDRSWLVLESANEVSRAMVVRTMEQAGLEGRAIEVWKEAGGWLVLVEVEDFVAADDDRLGRLGSTEGAGYRGVHRIGAYPVPFDPAIFGDERSAR